MYSWGTCAPRTDLWSEEQMWPKIQSVLYWPSPVPWHYTASVWRKKVFDFCKKALIRWPSLFLPLPPHAHFLLLTQPPYQLIAPCSGPKALTPCSVISTRLPETCLVALVTWIKGFSTGYLNLNWLTWRGEKGFFSILLFPWVKVAERLQKRKQDCWKEEIQPGVFRK